jgi:cell wall-associated NlpC family hydrolase
MEGITFITDKLGNKKQIVVDIEMHEKLLKKLFRKLNLNMDIYNEPSPRNLIVNDSGGLSGVKLPKNQLEEVKAKQKEEIELEEKKEIEATRFKQPESVLSAMSLHQQEKSLKIQAILEKAQTLVGTPYLFGGDTPSGMDCSGFTTETFKAAAIELPRISTEQSLIGEKVEQQQLKPGDLVFFGTGVPNRVNHVGIVANAESIDNIKFVHASTSKGVTMSSLSNSYWSGVYIKAKRVV